MSDNIPGIIIDDPDKADVVLLGLPYEKNRFQLNWYGAWTESNLFPNERSA